MKTRCELLKALGRLAVETGSLACLDCGWEHDCGVHGCAILRDVRSALEEAEACAAEAEAANHQLDGVVTTLMDSNRKLVDAVKSAEAGQRKPRRLWLPLWGTWRPWPSPSAGVPTTTPSAAPSATTTAPRRTTVPAGRGRSASGGGAPTALASRPETFLVTPRKWYTESGSA